MYSGSCAAAGKAKSKLRFGTLGCAAFSHLRFYLQTAHSIIPKWCDHDTSLMIGLVSLTAHFVAETKSRNDTHNANWIALTFRELPVRPQRAVGLSTYHSIFTSSLLCQPIGIDCPTVFTNTCDCVEQTQINGNLQSGILLRLYLTSVMLNMSPINVKGTARRNAT